MQSNLKVTKFEAPGKIPNIKDLISPEVLLVVEKICDMDPEDPSTYSVSSADLIRLCRYHEQIFTALALQFYDDPMVSKHIRRIRTLQFDLTQVLESRQKGMFTIAS